jgi:hypothetical protein
MILVRLDKDERLYGECSFKREPSDDHRFKFCETVRTVLFDNLRVFAHELHVSRILVFDEALLTSLAEQVRRQALPVAIEMV